MVLMFYYSVFLGNLDFGIATVMANSINPCSFMHRSPFLPYDGPEVTLAAFVALIAGPSPGSTVQYGLHSAEGLLSPLHPTSVGLVHSSTSPEYFAFYFSFASLVRSIEGRASPERTTNMEAPEISTIRASAILWWQFIGTTTSTLIILHFSFLLLAGKKGGRGSYRFLPIADEKDGFLN